MARKISVEILGDSSSLVNAFRRSSKEATRWNGSLTRATRGSLVAAVGFRGLGRSIAFASAAFVGGAGLTAAVKGSIEGFTKFEEQMQKTVGLANVAQGSVKSFSKEILALAPVVGKGPQELAQAFFFVASSGIKASKAMAVVRASAQGSVAGLGEASVVADALTSVINAYGAANINAAQAADVLAATVREGKGEAAQFAPVIGNVVALAAQLGVSFDQVGAALAVQTRLGTDAEITAIQLQRVFSTLLKVTPKSAEAFASVGLNADDLRDTLSKPNGLINVLTLVKAAFQGNTPALAAAFGDVRALRGILNLVGKQTKSTTEVFDKLAHSTGSASKAFKAVDKDSAQAFRKLRVSAQVAGIALGAIFTPVAVQIAKGLTVATAAFTKFVNKVQAAKGASAKFEIVTTGIEGLGERIGRELLKQFNRIDFAQAGHVISNKLVDGLRAVETAVRAVDWGKVGQIIVKDISDFIANVNWVGLFKTMTKVIFFVIVAQAKLLVGAGLELMKQLDAGIRIGAKFALLNVEKFVLELVKKIAGATSFLGHFDPFAGLKEKVAVKLKEIQKEIDALHGKTVEVKVVSSFVTDSRGFKGGGPAEPGRGTSNAEAAKKAANTEASVAALAAAARARAATAAAKAAKAAEEAKKKAVDAFAKITDSFSLREEQAAATKSLKDDIAVQKAFQTAILREMRIEGQTTALQQQLFESRQKVVESQKQIAENQAARKKSNQFKALGLTGEGEKITPSSGALLKKTGSLQEQIKGTVLDTSKTRKQLKNIATHLKGDFKNAGKDIRAAILEMLNDIASALDDKKGKGPLTKTSGLQTKKIVDGLGLSSDQIRELRQRLSGFNSGGRALSAGQNRQGSPGGFSGGDTVVESHVTVLLDGEKVGKAVTRSQQKKRRRNPRQKRGPNRHQS